DELVHAHRDAPVPFQVRDGGPQSGTEQLLGNMNFAFPVPDPNTPAEQDVTRLPLREMWQTWWGDRPAGLRDADGLELLRALAPLQQAIRPWRFGTGTELPTWLRRL